MFRILASKTFEKIVSGQNPYLQLYFIQQSVPPELHYQSQPLNSAICSSRTPLSVTAIEFSNLFLQNSAISHSHWIQ